MSERVRLQARVEVLESLLRQTLSLESAEHPPEVLDAEIDPGVAATFFLLGLEWDGGVERFITHSLGRLLQQLTRSTERQQVEYRGRVKGRIDWPATFKARYAQDYDPSRFVCREVRNRYDTPENQLLKFVMQRIDECLQAVPSVVWQGMCYRPAEEASPPLVTAPRLGRMDAAMHRLWRNVRLQEIHVPESVTEYHLLRAQTARLEEYAEVARVYRYYQAVVLRPSWNRLIRVGKHVLPLPCRRGETEDWWIRLGAVILRA